MYDTNGPYAFRKDSIEGSVIVEFIIEKDGLITNANVIKGVCPSIDAEAVRIISDMPKWKPGSDMRRPRRVRYRLAVDFYLDVGSTQQDDIFGLRIGMPVSEQEIVKLSRLSGIRVVISGRASRLPGRFR